MDEPHQRIQSGKLRPAGKKTTDSTQGNIAQKIQLPTVGIQDAQDLEIPDTDDILEHFLQTPTSLSDTHVGILTRIARECGVYSSNAINKDWRSTWNIGTWCIGNQVSASINIMQPNIAVSWINIVCNRYDDFNSTIEKYSKCPLQGSTCSATKTGSGYQIKGRWALHALDELNSLGIIKKESIDIASVHACQSRIFIWLLVGQNSEYLCTLTQGSIVLLAKYMPEWCFDNKENSAQNITLRMKNPEKINDASQLSISTAGWIQYNGRPDNIAKLYGAVAYSLREIMKSRFIKPFLESLHYDLLPEDF